MKKFSLFLVFLLCFSTLYALTDSHRIMWRTDPATSMVIGWNQLSGNNAIVYYGTTDHGTNYTAYTQSQAVDRSVSAFAMQNQFVRLTGLTANTAYYFVIVDSEGNSSRFWFKTTPDVETEKLSFIAGGDSRNNRPARQNANKLVAKLRPHAVLFGGDYTNLGTNGEWQEWFIDWQLTIGADGRMIPIVATRGNHESSNNHIVDLFDVPNGNVYYKTTFANNLISAYTLNTEISIGGAQADWLNNTLANDNATFKIAQYHKPVRSHNSGKSEGTNQYTYWVPLFDQYDMDLVVECDSHTSKSTWPIVADSGPNNDEGFIRDDLNGTIYIGEGCWGAPLRAADDAKSWTRDQGQFNQFKWICVGQEQIEVRTILVDNADQVGQVSDNDIFTPPANLDIFNPPNGSVIIIPNVNHCNEINLANFDLCSQNAVATITDDLSGVTYNYDSNTLYTIINGVESIRELDLNGNEIRNITLTGFVDTEGIVYLGNDEFAIIEEQFGRVIFLTIPDSPNSITINYPGSTEYIQLSGNFSGNVGLEGITYDKENDLLYLIKEKNPMAIYTISNPVSLKGTVVAPLSLFDLEQKASTYPSSLGFTDVSGLDFTSRGSLLILSDEGKSVVEVDPLTGRLLSYQDLITNNMTQPEGIAMINNDEFIIVGELNEFYKFTTDCGLICSSINSSLGDIEERNLGVISSSSTDLELTNDGLINGDQLIGLEFVNLNIPAGATITSANIQFTSDDSNSNDDPCNLLIQADNSTSPSALGTNNNNLSNRSRTNSGTTWSPPTWVNTSFAGPNQLTPDLSAVVQEIVDNAGSNSTNRIIFIISGTGRRTAASFDHSSVNGPPELCIEFDTNPSCIDSDFDGVCDEYDNCPTRSNAGQEDADNNGIGDVCENNTLTVCSSIIDGLSDVEQNGVDNSIYTNSSDLELVNDGSRGDQLIGLEFLNLNLPPQAIVQNAYIQFTTDVTVSNIDPCLLTIKAEQSTYPLSFAATANNVSNRPTTNASVNWSPQPWTAGSVSGADQRSPNLAPIFDELLKNLGNVPTLHKVIFIISGTGKRIAAAYENATNNPPQLCIEYQLPYSCVRSYNATDNINEWVGPRDGYWYEDPCYWSKGVFPTSCDDVLIDMSTGGSVTIRPGATGYGYTIEVTQGTIFETAIGAELCTVAGK